jgi:hypothetical protein
VLFTHQAPYPTLVQNIKDSLINLQKAGVPVTASTMRCIMIAMIQSHAPSLFTTKQKYGSVFACSPFFVRKFAKNKLNWSFRHSTRAAQKIPDKVEGILQCSLLRQSFSIKTFAIPDALRVNSDQTQCILQQGSKVTWNQ